MNRRLLLVVPLAIGLTGLVGCKEKSEKEKLAQHQEMVDRAYKMKPLKPMTVDLNKDKK